MPRPSIFAALLSLAACAAAADARRPDAANMTTAADAVPGEQMMSVPLAGGGQQHLLYAAPARPRATIVMLPGGAGDVGLERDGDVRHGDNFVVRTRAAWVARGYAVVIPDTIDRANLRGDRSSPAYADVVARLVAFAHGHAAGPVFLLGTSQGSIAAMNGAAHASGRDIAGVVLTESVTVLGGSHETVFDAHPEAVRVPALVVANRDDRCSVAPPANAARIAQAMTGSQVQLAYVSGGEQRSNAACGSLSPHGYYGIEPKVIALISQWMAARG